MSVFPETSHPAKRRLITRQLIVEITQPLVGGEDEGRRNNSEWRRGEADMKRSRTRGEGSNGSESIKKDSPQGKILHGELRSPAFLPVCLLIIPKHRGCYGVDGESDSIMSSASENSTEPWFCDACKNGVTPSCELCPNQDGIFKETDAGRWVHVVCALYVPGVAFGDIDKLRPVTLTEMNYSKYGAKECSFCEDARFSRTGVCISCDAGMCRSYFHVTCAQREGLLSEAAAEEDIADPFFAYCKQHADRFDRKWKRKNYLALQSYCKVSLQEREKQLTPEAQARITTRLQQYRAKAELSRNTRPQAWVPREKLPRPLTSSASAIRKLMRKAELMGISTDIFPVDTSDANASMDGRRKHKQPALTADFVNYYMERNMRMIQIQDNISEQKSLKDKLESEQEKLHVEYNKLCESLEELLNVNGDLRSEGQAVWTLLGDIMGQKLNTPAVLKAPKERKPSKKEGGNTGKASSLPAILYSCGICKKNQDQHLLVLCDTCKLYYHLGCLEPPLTRMPKKTKNSYWQCSECDQASSDEADIAMETLPDGTKRSRRQIKGPIKFIPQEMSPEPKKHQPMGSPWEVHGKCMGSPWEVHGKSMGSAWEVHGKCMGSPWEVHGKCMGSAWEVHGKCMGSAWEVHGKCMEVAWEVHGKCMGSAWEVHGKSMGSAWEVHGKSMVLLLWESSKMEGAVSYFVLLT
nr:LOW QUALITY PROTEIN: PHD finger protein 14-like [Pseudochaenichthys georgianus]